MGLKFNQWKGSFAKDLSRQICKTNLGCAVEFFNFRGGIWVAC